MYNVHGFHTNRTSFETGVQNYAHLLLDFEMEVNRLVENELPRCLFVTLAHIFMQSSGQQGSGPDGADVSDSSPPPPPPPFENVRDFDLWPVNQSCEDEGRGPGWPKITIEMWME